MKPLIVLSIGALWLPLSLHSEAAPYPPINPALLYWQAAALLPKLSDAQSAEIRDMVSGKIPVDPAKIETLGLSAAEGILRKAASSTAVCDWGLLLEEGPYAPLPHLSKIREMAQITLVQGEALLSQGKTAEGIDWLLTTHRIARHSGAGSNLISYLVQLSIEQSAFRTAARHCLAWAETTRRAYAAKLSALPPLHSLAEAYVAEEIFVDWFERFVQRDEPQRHQRLKEMVALLSGPNDGTPNAEAQRKKIQALEDPENLRQEIVELRACQQRTLAILGKPWKESKPALEAISESLNQSKSILAKETFPVVAQVNDKTFAVATYRTMLEAALAHGTQLDEARAATYHDAFEGEALRLKKNADGTLSLVAAEQHPKGKVLELKLGK